MLKMSNGTQDSGVIRPPGARKRGSQTTSPFGKPVFGSALSLSAILVVILNMIFRIGISKHKALSGQPSADSLIIVSDTIEAQVESGIVYGLSAALYGQISSENGGAVEGNFDRYPILRMRDMPEVETHIIAEGDPVGGVGEVGLPCIAPAVCNALFAITGEPIRRLPIGDRFKT